MAYEIQNLSKAYGDRQVLTNLSLTLEEGGLYALTGPSGRGKTTLLHILLGLVTADGGEFPRLRCSAVFQENRLLPRRSPVRNLLPVAGKGRPEGEIRAFLSEILPQDCLDKPVEALSGGMQRRTAIARAMIAQSELVVLDEPFTGLDAGTAQSVVAFLLRHQRGRTLLIATHQPELLEGCGAEVIAL